METSQEYRLLLAEIMPPLNKSDGRAGQARAPWGTGAPRPTATGLE